MGMRPHPPTAHSSRAERGQRTVCKRRNRRFPETVGTAEQDPEEERALNSLPTLERSHVWAKGHKSAGNPFPDVFIHDPCSAMGRQPSPEAEL